MYTDIGLYNIYISNENRDNYYKIIVTIVSPQNIQFEKRQNNVPFHAILDIQNEIKQKRQTT